jgi:carbonic anhydrase/acetyltransferase-like protein (isoleucine patch superfamily)
MIRALGNLKPQIHPSVFVTESADIIGDVVIGKNSSVWFNAVIRGDVNSIRIGERTNIQDGCLLHVRNETSPLVIGSNVTVGHGAILHGCTIHDCCLIGMGAIVLDNVEVHSYALVAAGTVVLNNTIIPEGVLVAGVPARVVRTLSDEERKMVEESATKYVQYATRYSSTIG